MNINLFNGEKNKSSQLVVGSLIMVKIAGFDNALGVGVFAHLISDVLYPWKPIQVTMGIKTNMGGKKHIGDTVSGHLSSKKANTLFIYISPTL